jgi:predicted CXXCH cytochrome family protein
VAANALALAAACRSDRGGEGTGKQAQSIQLVVSADGTEGLDLARLRVSPRGAVRSTARLGDGSVLVSLDATRASGVLALELDGACPVEVPLAGRRAGDVVPATLRPWISLGGDRAQVGFDAPFVVEVVPGCRQAIAGKIEWRQSGGGSLPQLVPVQNGFRLHGKTASLSEAHPLPLPWGIVPLSQRTRGEVELEATWSGHGTPVRRRVRVAAAARATGLPSVALGQRVLLGGAGWRLLESPPAASREALSAGPPATLLPDQPGRWVLADESGTQLAVRVGRHDQVPLDCGRSDCHPREASASVSSPMTTVLERAWRAEHGRGQELGCALGCHATGEPGLADGGFAALLRESGRGLATMAGQGWAELPRELRRVGGVTCTGCHGPAAVPEPTALWTVLRSDVCATCHDAPPRYGVVAAWLATAMARADADAGARTDPACAACHTSAGFLHALRARSGEPRVPPRADPIGIACAACHASHGPHVARALVRDVSASVAAAAELTADQTASGVCLPCHMPAQNETVPSASAAALWLGRPGERAALVRAATPAPHLSVQGGCIGCHAGEDRGEGWERGASHTFRVSGRACVPCHDREKVEERPGRGGMRVAERARALFDRHFALRAVPLAVRGAGGVHAAGPQAERDPDAARALWNVMLVLEDPAAGAHNAPLARELLDEAERLLGRGQ